MDMTAIWQNNGSGWHLLVPTSFPGAGLVSIYNNNGSAYLQFWRSVFERRAPSALARIEASIMPIKQGNTTHEVSDALLEALTEAYREAAGRPLTIESVGG